LSGGQRQRLAVAAAVLRRPAVLCIDDATSALDSATERRLLAGLRHHLAGTTIVLITHRLAAAAWCDRHVRLADGAAVPVEPADVSASWNGSRP
jgi:ABC-type bacteriocin/lantibiotic exporter with double-glycine peptidase domain